MSHIEKHVPHGNTITEENRHKTIYLLRDNVLFVAKNINPTAVKSLFPKLFFFVKLFRTQALYSSNIPVVDIEYHWQESRSPAHCMDPT